MGIVAIVVVIVLSGAAWYQDYHAKQIPNEKSKKNRIPRPVDLLFRFKICALIMGLTLAIGGSGLLYTAWAGSRFLGAFLLVTGLQVFLWVIGIRLEIFGNVPVVIVPRAT